MASNKMQYDARVGGSVQLENQVQTYRYAAGAIQEIRAILKEVNNEREQRSKLLFQSLPKQMRRRAMSHHPKRLPRVYRAAHIAQMAKSGDSAKLKRPSRKYRRRPRNLLKAYIRRQRRHIWLETHIWHAKRFHMINRWGYRLPHTSCDKTFRTCYRATTKHCLLQDISYYACVELRGALSTIGKGFEALTSSKCGLSIMARTFTTGRREGSLELFKAWQYPYGALGRVQFMWCPATNESSSAMRQLWLWLHPGIYSAVLSELIKVFELISTKSVIVPITEEERLAVEQTNGADNKTKKQQRLQFMSRTNSYERIKRYKNVTTGLELSELKDTMNRFRLTGPLSQAVLSKAFQCKSLEVVITDNQTTSNWFNHLFNKKDSFRSQHEQQAAYWQKCQAVLQSPDQLMSNMILSLNIDDPRVHRPNKRAKALPNVKAAPTVDVSDLLISADMNLAKSVLWQANIRDRLYSDMLNTTDYCRRRAKEAAIPGGPCRFEFEMQPVPVLLIQRPGSQLGDYKRLGYGCGWDVIAPAGYGMSLWLAMIMWGARPGGLRECETMARELCIDMHQPDALAGKQHATERHAELKAKYFRLPTNKRCNYRKLAIVSPFRAPFAQLVRDWQNAKQPVKNPAPTNGVAMGSYYVLRDIGQLRQLNLFMQHKINFPDSLSLQPNCLLQVQVLMKTRGHPDDFAIICLPSETDLKQNLRHIKRHSHEPVYTEPLLSDPAESERKRLRIEHTKLLKRLRARRLREKRKLQETATKRVYIRAANTAKLNLEHAQLMSKLWLPEDFDTLFSVRKQCTREVIGYMTSANFSYIESTCGGIGYITLGGLRALMQCCSGRVKQALCLVRGTTSRHYRFASLQLHVPL